MAAPAVPNRAPVGPDAPALGTRGAAPRTKPLGARGASRRAKSRVARRIELGDGARTTIALIAVLAITGVVLALTHSSPTPAPRAAANPHGLIAGATLQQARCSNWLHATQAEKDFAVRSLAGIAGAPTEYKGVRGTSLTRDEAYNLLNGACAHSIARNFLLYELYNRAAGFRSVALQQP